jgi:hypothetical protein
MYEFFTYGPIFLLLLFSVIATWGWGYSTGHAYGYRLAMRDCRGGEDVRLANSQPANQQLPGPGRGVTPGELLIQGMESEGAWLLRFRSGDEVLAVLCDKLQEQEAAGPDNPRFSRFCIPRLVGPARYLKELHRCCQPDTWATRANDGYFSPQKLAGPVTVLQKPLLVSIGSITDVGDDMVCWRNLILETRDELVTLDEIPADIL